MRDIACVEFYEGASGPCLARLDVPFAPRVGDLISVRQKTWRVLSVTWALDGLDQTFGRTLRACVSLIDPEAEDNTHDQ